MKNKKPDLFKKANLSMVNFDAALLVLAIVQTTTDDKSLSLKLKNALKGLRKLKRLIKGDI